MLKRLALLTLVTMFLAAAPCVGTGAAAEQQTITIAHYHYDPPRLEVHAGDTVTWTNTDDAPHTVTTTSGPAPLDSPELRKGDSWSFMFATPGEYDYFCTVHPEMTAVVAVQPAEQVASPAPATTTVPRQMRTSVAPTVARPARRAVVSPAAVVTAPPPRVYTVTHVGAPHPGRKLVAASLAVAFLVTVLLQLAQVGARRPEPGDG